MREDLSSLIPTSKHDTEKARSLVALGYPAVEPVLPQILEWVQDLNWPVARVFQSFLSGIGAPLAPFVRVVLATQDDSWKYFVLIGIVAPSVELAKALRLDLERLAKSPTAGEMTEEVSDVAAEILQSLHGRANS